MPDSQSSEPGFESLFVTVSKIGHFRPLHWCPCSLSCINEYLAIDSGGNVSDLALARNCCVARMLPGEAELVSEWTGEAKSLKRFERSNGLDTALYKNYLYLFYPVVFRTCGLRCCHSARATVSKPCVPAGTTHEPRTFPSAFSKYLYPSLLPLHFSMHSLPLLFGFTHPPSLFHT